MLRSGPCPPAVLPPPGGGATPRVKWGGGPGARSPNARNHHGHRVRCLPPESRARPPPPPFGRERRILCAALGSGGEGGGLQGDRTVPAPVLPLAPRPGPGDGCGPAEARGGGGGEERAFPGAPASGPLRPRFPCLSPRVPALSGLVIFCTRPRVTSAAAGHPEMSQLSSPLSRSAERLRGAKAGERAAGPKEAPGLAAAGHPRPQLFFPQGAQGCGSP